MLVAVAGGSSPPPIFACQKILLLTDNFLSKVQYLVLKILNFGGIWV